MTSFLFEKVGSAWKSADAENRSSIFAFAIVPLLTFTIANASSRASLPYAVGGAPMSVVAVTAATSAALSDAVVIVVQPDYVSATVDVTPTPARVFTSLNAQQLAANTQSLATTAKGLSIQAPFNDTGKPVVIVAQGRAGETVTVDGKKLQLVDAMIPAVKAVHLAVAVLLCAAFALGLGFASSVSMKAMVEQRGAE